MAYAKCRFARSYSNRCARFGIAEKIPAVFERMPSELYDLSTGRTKQREWWSAARVTPFNLRRAGSLSGAETSFRIAIWGNMRGTSIH